MAWLGALLFAWAAGCSSAPLAGKSCPCATGYTCCQPSNTCVADNQQCPRCTPIKLTSMSITRDGAPHPQPDGGPDAVQFGADPEQWVSYTYQGTGQNVPTVAMTPDGNGFRVMASVDVSGGGATYAYAGAGVSFLSKSECIDGTDLTGVEFEFACDVGQSKQLIVGVVADEDVSITSGDLRGRCTGGMNTCFGQTVFVDATAGMHQVPFQSLTGGMPVGNLSLDHIVDVQWQLPAVQIPSADFTISNVQFY